MEIAVCLRVDPTVLRPGDVFGVDVAKSAGFVDNELDELGIYALARAEGLGLKADLSCIVTVNDYVLKLAKKNTGRE